MSSYRINLDAPIEYLKGVGPVKGPLLRKYLSIDKVGDLLMHLPFRYVDRSQFWTINQINFNTDSVQLKARIVSVFEEGSGRFKRLIAHIEDNTGSMELIWFQGFKWIQTQLEIGNTFIIYGKVNYNNGRLSIAHPELEKIPLNQGNTNIVKYQAIYSSTEQLSAKGLHSKGLHQLQVNLFALLLPEQIEENLPEYILAKLNLLTRYDAFKKIHLPLQESDIKKSQSRLKFEELFFIQMKILFAKQLRRQQQHGYLFEQNGSYFNEFYQQHLPFALTDAQKKVIKEIHLDMYSGYQMNRLLQGDVGSGKTIVSFLIMLIAIGNGYQTCIMAPTEVLANQHYQSLTKYTDTIGLRTCLIKSQIKAKQKKEILQDLIDNKIHIAIGTHALIEDPIQFHNLGLCVIDEQHRFGVEQRAKLWKKAKNGHPHVLVMTATPIPRTLAMTSYGDLDVSIIDELPPNRKEIKTVHMRDNHRMQLYNFMKEQISLGRQIYIVFPLIEESEKLDLENLNYGYEKLLEYFPLPNYRVSVVHGKMKPIAKQEEMKRFVSGNAHIMVATTVIEVGVNVPNASVMVIENSERFGLSQVHQLRGRVGRGADQSYCILMTGSKVSIEAQKRIETLVSTTDGFKIAEADLEMRGPGDLEGTAQSGMIQLKVADIVEDNAILITARKFAEAILNKDPNLDNPVNLLLKNQFAEGNSFHTWSRIS